MISYEWKDGTIQDKNIAHFELISFQNRKTIEEFATGSSHYRRYSWLMGVCRMFPETLTMFPTKLCGFPTLVCVWKNATNANQILNPTNSYNKFNEILSD